MCTALDLHIAIIRLSKPRLRDVVAALERTGALPLLLRDLPPALRVDFLDKCVDAGIVDEIPGLAPGTDAHDAPCSPALLINRGNLPRSLRRLVHDENIARVNAYATAYETYLKRFQRAVREARCLEDIRALGAPAAFFVPGVEPGLDFDGDDDLVVDFFQRTRRLDDTPGYEAIHRRTFLLRDAA